MLYALLQSIYMSHVLTPLLLFKDQGFLLTKD